MRGCVSCTIDGSLGLILGVGVGFAATRGLE